MGKGAKEVQNFMGSSMGNSVDSVDFDWCLQFVMLAMLLFSRIS
jgi:hypothetical protein